MTSSSAAALYATFLIAGTAAIVAPEALERPMRGLGRRDLGRAMRVDVDKYEVAVTRGSLEAGGMEEADRIALHLHAMRREGWIRDAQTGVLLFLTAASALFLVAAAPAAVRLRQATAPRGHVEILEDETRVIPAEAFAAEMSRLAPTRNEAIERLRSGPRLRCGYCGRMSRWDVLGRIGRRLFVKKPPEGAKDMGIHLGEGWWHLTHPPAPCRRCGSKETVEA
ncbi:MAG TPA: hypothetical protein VMV18_11915 [bacterium]|nr:hypothetical protein [bacterium]